MSNNSFNEKQKSNNLNKNLLNNPPSYDKDTRIFKTNINAFSNNDDNNYNHTVKLMDMAKKLPLSPSFKSNKCFQIPNKVVNLNNCSIYSNFNIANNSNSIKNKLISNLTNINNPDSFPVPANYKALSIFEDKIFVMDNLKKILKNKLNKYRLNIGCFSDVDVINTLNNGLEEYLKNLIESLIKISRIRSSSLEKYSKYCENTNNVS